MGSAPPSFDPARPNSRAQRWFAMYCRRKLRRHFTALRVLRGAAPASPPGPLVVFANHPSWWDPIAGALLADEFLRDRQHFAPIDADALERYPIFRRLGFFPVRDGVAGARQFLRAARAILDRDGACLWITPGGRFSDVRQRPDFQPGLARLGAMPGRVTFVPLALEYVFWDEPRPEALAAFGAPIQFGDEMVAGIGPALQRALGETQARLADAAIARDAGAFQVLTGGKAGAGGIYEWWQSARAALRGERFDPSHASIKSLPTHPKP